MHVMQFMVHGWSFKSFSLIKLWVQNWVFTLDFHVSELIDSNKSCWNLDLIEKLFLPCEVDSIKSIPLSMRMFADKLIWAKTNNGLFTVKSTYKVAVDILDASPLGCSGCSPNESNMRCFWKCVWKLDVPHEVQHFMWRACCDILSTKRNLRRWQILLEDICDVMSAIWI